MKARKLGDQLEAAKANVEAASHAITAGYEAEDERVVASARRKLEAAEAAVVDLGHRVTAAGLRAASRSRAWSRRNSSSSELVFDIHFQKP